MKEKNITITISNHCNIDCSYCCIQNRNTSPILSFSKIDEFLKNEVINKGYKVKVLEFFGGEPTLHYDTISQVVNKYPNFPYRIMTNGIFDFELWKDALSFFDEIIISHDGPNSLSKKRGIGASLSYIEKLESNIKKCIEENFPITVASVLSTQEHFDSLPTTVDYFRNNFGVRSFSIEIASVIQDKYLNKNLTKENFNKIIDYYFSFVIPSFLKSQYENKFLFNIPKEFYPGSFNKVPCSKTNLALSPLGNIYGCRDISANESNLIKESKLSFFSNKNIISNIEKSNTCYVKALQGFSYDDFIDENNEILVKSMYTLISLCNSFYYFYINKKPLIYSGIMQQIDEIYESCVDYIRALKE